MLTVLATLPFLAALGVAALTLQASVGGNWRKIVAALQGRSLLAQPLLSTRPVSVRFSGRAPSLRPARTAVPRWRAAA